MARIIEDELYTCDDCTVAIASGDYSGMDTATEARVRRGYESLFRRGYAVIGEDLGFMHHSCDCCLVATAGNRHELSLLA